MKETETIKINICDTYYDSGICKFKDTNLPLNGIYEDKIGAIRYFKNGKCHNENGPAYIEKDGYKAYYTNSKRHRIDGHAVISPNGDYGWHINDYHIEKEIMDNWLKENDIPLDWNKWTNEDKMLFALHWSDYNG